MKVPRTTNVEGVKGIFLQHGRRDSCDSAVRVGVPGAFIVDAPMLRTGRVERNGSMRSIANDTPHDHGLAGVCGRVGKHHAEWNRARGLRTGSWHMPASEKQKRDDSRDFHDPKNRRHRTTSTAGASISAAVPNVMANRQAGMVWTPATARRTYQNATAA